MAFVALVITAVVLSACACYTWVAKWTWLKDKGTAFTGKHPAIAVCVQRLGIIVLAIVFAMVGIAGALYFSRVQMSFAHRVIWSAVSAFLGTIGSVVANYFGRTGYLMEQKGNWCVHYCLSRVRSLLLASRPPKS